MFCRRKIREAQKHCVHSATRGGVGAAWSRSGGPGHGPKGLKALWPPARCDGCRTSRGRCQTRGSPDGDAGSAARGSGASGSGASGSPSVQSRLQSLCPCPSPAFIERCREQGAPTGPALETAWHSPARLIAGAPPGGGGAAGAGAAGAGAAGAGAAGAGAAEGAPSTSGLLPRPRDVAVRGFHFLMAAVRRSQAVGPLGPDTSPELPLLLRPGSRQRTESLARPGRLWRHQLETC